MQTGGTVGILLSDHSLTGARGAVRAGSSACVGVPGLLSLVLQAEASKLIDDCRAADWQPTRPWSCCCCCCCSLDRTHVVTHHDGFSLLDLLVLQAGL